MLEPLGIFGHGQNLAGCIQAIAHSMNVLDVEEGYFTSGIVLFVLVAATGSAIGQRVYVGAGVHDVQALIGVIQIGNRLQVHLVPEAALASDTHQWLGAAHDSYIAVIWLHPAEHRQSTFGSEFGNEL